MPVGCMSILGCTGTLGCSLMLRLCFSAESERCSETSRRAGESSRGCRGGGTGRWGAAGRGRAVPDAASIGKPDKIRAVCGEAPDDRHFRRLAGRRTGEVNLNRHSAGRHSRPHVPAQCAQSFPPVHSLLCVCANQSGRGAELAITP